MAQGLERDAPDAVLLPQLRGRRVPDRGEVQLLHALGAEVEKLLQNVLAQVADFLAGRPVGPPLGRRLRLRRLRRQHDAGPKVRPLLGGVEPLLAVGVAEEAVAGGAPGDQVRRGPAAELVPDPGAVVGGHRPLEGVPTGTEGGLGIDESNSAGDCGANAKLLVFRRGGWRFDSFGVIWVMLRGAIGCVDDEDGGASAGTWVLLRCAIGCFHAEDRGAAAGS
eukprot:CAMPEP_0170267260 /NCGR_PEP_ID=MMETSP0116_2-20130129/33553_1 /TAXON_ID=400756 /ORGANISM="Durinskia baltica, Strain CSIRO CS-38" /LENGTH=221 /DNA_ID=CAMNT_0010518409 /DNA_START=66 /DNA_END=728 /DNA_ORIENTATION=-